MTYEKDALDEKVNARYPGKAVRKDLVHRIKKGFCAASRERS